MKCKNGYTLIELIITLGIVAFITVFIMTFFSVNLNNIYKIKNNSELQFQAQYILNFLSDRVMESKNVEVAISGTNSVLKSKKEYNITNLALRYGESSDYCYLFRVADNKIFYGKGKSSVLASSELGTYVKELKLKPYPDGNSFSEANGLIITVVLIKGEEEYNASQLIYMRLS